MCCPLILCEHKTMSEAKDLTRCKRSKSRKMAWQKDKKENVWTRKQEASWTAQAVRLAEQGKLQAKGKDYHKSSTLCHMVTLRSNDKGNILR